MIVLHDYWRSSAAYRVRIALALKGVEHGRVSVSLIDGEQRGDANLSVNPQGLVPTLVVDGTAITQSLAILDWLDTTCPDPPLFPRDAVARAATWARALVIAADIHPIDNLRVLNRLGTQFGATQLARDDWYRHWLAEGFAALEAMAGPGPWLGGGAPDLSDLCLVPQMYNARRFALPLDAYPRLVAADAVATAHPAFRAAHPDQVRPA